MRLINLVTRFVKSSNILLKHSKIRLKCASSNVLPQCASYVPPQCASRFDSNVLLQCASNVPPQRDEARPQIYAVRKNKHGRPVEGPKLLFMFTRFLLNLRTFVAKSALSRLRALGGTFWPKFGGRRHQNIL